LGERLIGEQVPHDGFCWNVNMEPSTQYRTFAEECRRLAKSAKTVEERKVLWERQAIWTTLAAEEADGKSS
jgi:hypothetical protein